MAKLSRRLSSLEGGNIGSESVRKRLERLEWEHCCQDKRATSTPLGALIARDAIRELHEDGHLGEMSAEETVEAIASAHEISPNIARLEVYRAIFNRKPGTEQLELPDEWRESFEAGAKVRRLFAAMGPRDAARWVLKNADQTRHEGATDEEASITNELEHRAIGPDISEISEAERRWRVGEYVYDLLSSAWGYQMAQHASKLETER